ncbi:MAG: RNA pyrophosphohydrolase [Rhodospirillaceae bacterium]|nr:RNA pyrophosphohydrolase [Rhodospirillaceae bacterium]
MTDHPRNRLPYRQCAGIVLFNREGNVFVGKRLDQTGSAWQLPQGGIEKEEAPRTAALRELEEETGARSVTVLAEASKWHTYELPDELIGKVWNGKYRGQRQKWFAMQFIGDEEEINPASVQHPEFSTWRWARLNDLPRLAVPFKRNIYAAIALEFAIHAVPIRGV